MSLSDEAKGALWKLRSKRYKPGYLYYPAGKVWLPAQCDLEGRLVIDPTDLDTRYHKKDEDVDIGALKIVADEFVLRNAATFTGLDIMNALETASASVMMNVIYVNGLIQQAAGSTCQFSTQNTNYATFQFRAYDTAYRTVATMVNGMMNIPRAGDITMLASKTLDLATNSAEFKPRRTSVSAQPTPTADTLEVWRDPDDNKTYLIYNDTDEGVRKAELT